MTDRTTRRATVLGIASTFAGCNQILEGNSDRNNQQPTESPTPSPSATPEPDPELDLEVVKNPEVNLKPDMRHVNQIGEVATVLRGKAQTGTQEGFTWSRLVLNGNTENAVPVEPETVENGFVLPPALLNDGKNTVQLQERYNGETYTSEPVTQKTSFPKGHRLDIQVPENIELSTGLENITQYSTPFKYDTLTINEQLQQPHHDPEQKE